MHQSGILSILYVCVLNDLFVKYQAPDRFYISINSRMERAFRENLRMRYMPDKLTLVAIQSSEAQYIFSELWNGSPAQCFVEGRLRGSP